MTGNDELLTLAQAARRIPMNNNRGHLSADASGAGSSMASAA